MAERPRHPVLRFLADALSAGNLLCGVVSIGCAIASYDGTIYLGLTADVGAAPDAHLLRDYLVESYVELREAAGVAPEV